MKKSQTICLCILFMAGTLHAAAQGGTNTGTDTTTKQDAVDFITKVINQFPATPYNNTTYSDFKETTALDGCNLVIVKSYKDDNYNGGYTIWKDSIVFNLSSSTYDDKE